MSALQTGTATETPRTSDAGRQNGETGAAVAAPRTLDDIVTAVVRRGAPVRVAVAACAEPNALAAVLEARDMGMAVPVLVGDIAATEHIATERNLSLEGCEVEDEPVPVKAVQRAVDRVRTGGADVLMKGLVNTDVLLRVVLNRVSGLSAGGLLSHVAVCSLPAACGGEASASSRLVCITDAAVNISPNMERKLGIVRNAICVARSLGIPSPRVAMLAATEKVMLPAMPATLDAQIVARMADQGEFGDAMVAGPMALDVAISPDIAARKGVSHPVAGRADILCAPDIESGNILYKSLTTLAHVEMAGILTGTTAPVVVPSRGDSRRSKLLSLALAAYVAMECRL